jgi:signal transduction histidine kinase
LTTTFQLTTTFAAANNAPGRPGNDATLLRLLDDRAVEEGAEQFVADAGHELRTPPTGVRGYANHSETGIVVPGPAGSNSVVLINMGYSNGLNGPTLIPGTRYVESDFN